MAEMKGALTGADIRKMATEWHGLDLSDLRADQIAAEMNTFNNVTRAAADRLRYDDQPGSFAGVLKKSARSAQ
jgi:predicted TPR repeat methyltransferase